MQGVSDRNEPFPDIHSLFVHYNSLYFEDALGATNVQWSSQRMTLCGGICEQLPGGGCRIKLSEPLLKFRGAQDIKNVLLHEMIHAFMFTMHIKDNDSGGHGDYFKALAQKINNSTLPDQERPEEGYSITVYHSMFAEVAYYRQHHWQCARCGDMVKRAMNRKPQEADCRSKLGTLCADVYCKYHMHARFCGGMYVKTKEPEGYGNKKAKPSTAVSRVRNNSADDTRPITDFFFKKQDKELEVVDLTTACPEDAVTPQCPLCGRIWEHTTSYHEMNLHVNECLTRNMPS